MHMLTKFESKSSRAKCVVFHPQRPWILVALHSSTIQLWDYRMGTLIDRFEGHDGPVRGVDFHKTQPLFASCGDDYTVRVWSLQTRKCLFTLNGHLDYVRTVFFHPELPWLLTCSDDQTIRIWNWQNRKEIACLTGHNHYVYCAQFHPTQDLIVSASLDQTVRVWDISGLRKRHSAPSSSSPAFSFEEQMARANSMALSQQSGMGGTSTSSHDMFGTDAIVKYVLEGHDRGINWAAFHPTLPLIISAGDDRVVKLWRMSETKAWEVDTCRGHTANVICCAFHPFQDLILSVGEDKTIRVWDLHKRTPVQQFKRDPDRFWHISPHPSVNLFAAAHDEGVMVFKLERERPASTLSPQENSLLYVNREKAVIQCDLNTGMERPLVSLKKVALAPWTPFRSMSYNPADRSILVVSKETAVNLGSPALAPPTTGTYELVSLPKTETGAATDPQNTLRGSGDQALFISRNRFLVFNAASQTLEVRDLGNAITKTVKSPVANTKDIVYGGAPGVVLILGASSVALYSVQQKTVIAEASVNGVKYASWSNDGNYVALLAKHGITVVDKDLETVSFVHETIRIKSATWDVSTPGVLVYTTLNHLKYALLNGDCGILRSLQNTMYVIKAQNENVACINRDGTVKVLKIDPTEYRFKRALVNNDFNEVLRIIKTSQLVGQSIIAYVQNKGYAEIALQFVQDPQTRFDLAIESGNIAVAHEQAKILNNPATWKILGEEALAQGNHDVVEDVYQRQREFDRLSFMYLATGNTERLAKMEQVAANRDDVLGMFQTSIFARSVEPRIALLRNNGMMPLAYSLAKSNGLTDLADEILAEAGLSETDVRIPTHSVKEKTYPTPKVETFKSNWPVKPSPLSFFEKALLGNMESLSLEETSQFTDANLKKAEKPGIFKEKTLGKSSTAPSKSQAAAEESESEGEAEDWDIDLGGDVAQTGAADLIDINDEGEPIGGPEGSGNVTGADEGISEPSLWTRSSQVPADHVAAGSFETAMHLLNRQAAVVEFAPLKSRFLDVYKGCHLYLNGNEGLEPISYYPRRKGNKPLPLVPDANNIATLIEQGQALVADTYKSMREKTVKVSTRKLENIVTHFRQTLHAILLTACENAEEAETVKQSITLCREYILAFSIELERRRIQKAEPENKKRELELAALFTKPRLAPQDRAYQLVTAMMTIVSRKNFQLASGFASELLEMEPEHLAGGMDRWLEDAKKIVVAAERAPLDPIEVDYDQFADFNVCPATLTPIYAGVPSVSEPLTRAVYHADYKGTVCVITGVTSVGSIATGLRLFA